MQNSMVLFTFFVFDRKYLFGQIWSKSSKSFFQSEIWYLDYFEYGEFKGDGRFVCFRLEIFFLGKFGPKNQNSLFKLQFGT